MPSRRPCALRRCPTCNETMRKYLCTQCRELTVLTSYQRTDEHREKMSQVHRGKKKNYPSASNDPVVAAKITAAWTPEKREEKRQQMIEMAKDPNWRKNCGRSGEENARWKDGASETVYAPGFTRYLKLKIRERDWFTCQLCGITEDELGHALSVHHIDYSKDNHHPDNLASTCVACNSRVNTNQEIWFAYFTVLAEARCNLGKDILKFIGRKVFTQHEGYAIISRLDGPNLSGTVFESIVKNLSSAPI